MSTLSDLLRENRFTPDSVAPFERKLFFEEERRRPYLERFSVLLFLAVVIATCGIIGDSTATVIGAMIVAPLMTPIMATTAALITGRTDRAFRSILLVGIGVLGVITLSWLLGLIYGGPLSFESNSQITARIYPRVLDLVAALASGAAGAFCMSREDVADSLPGVAIAISLVPPLCVVGLSLSAGEWAAAEGALLLFITNMLAILLAGGGVLAVLGLPKAAMADLYGGSRRSAFIAIIIAVVIVTVPLAITGAQLSHDSWAETEAKQVTENWLEGTDFTMRSVAVTNGDVDVVITGPGEPPPFAQLVAAMEKEAGQPVKVELEVIPSQKMQTPPLVSTAAN